MGRRFRTWWEALPARQQAQRALPASLLVLFAFHEAFFPLLTWDRSLMYAVMWSIPLTLAIVFATQVEVGRTARETAARDDAAQPVDGDVDIDEP